MAVAPAAHADPMPPSYTLTDLGSGTAFDTSVLGDGIVTTTNGQMAYAFPQAFTGTPMATPANSPILDPVPTGTDGTGYSRVSGVTMYPNGIAIATDQVGSNSLGGASASWEGADIYNAQRNANGSWGQPVELMSAAKNYGAPIGYVPNLSATLSQSGDILESTLMIPGTGVVNSAGVYKIGTWFKTR